MTVGVGQGRMVSSSRRSQRAARRSGGQVRSESETAPPQPRVPRAEPRGCCPLWAAGVHAVTHIPVQHGDSPLSLPCLCPLSAHTLLPCL